MITTMNTNTLKTNFALWCMLLLSIPLSLNAYHGGSPTTIFETLMKDGVLDITIETDLSELIYNRRRDDYQPATLSYTDQKNVPVYHQIEVGPRGKFRRRICDFPPVKIKFSKKALAAAGLKKHNNLDLTTHCLEDRDAGHFNVFREYLAYKLYNELSPASFRVQLVRVTYVDTKGVVKKMKRYGFIIEDDEELAERLGGKLCDCLNVDTDRMDSEAEVMASVFNYMIGNEDWSLSMVRNLKMVESANIAKLTPVPYDFDFSGLVNASYAVPSVELDQRHIKDRDYLGPEADPAVLGLILARYVEKKSALYKIINDFKLLPVEHRQDMKAYLDSFYKTIETLPEGSRRLPPWRYATSGEVRPMSVSGY